MHLQIAIWVVHAPTWLLPRRKPMNLMWNVRPQRAISNCPNKFNMEWLRFTQEWLRFALSRKNKVSSLCTKSITASLNKVPTRSGSLHDISPAHPVILYSYLSHTTRKQGENKLPQVTISKTGDPEVRKTWAGTWSGTAQKWGRHRIIFE